MRRSYSAWVLGSVVWLLACAGETGSSGSNDMRGSAATGSLAGSATPAMPSAGSSADFGNAAPMMPRPGAAGMPGPAKPPASRANCKGGLYLGTYDCNVDFGGIQAPLQGDVSFTLEIDATVVREDCDLEFCPELVIAEGSGTLFGLAGAIGFEAKLEGGLDCQTGEFRASAPGGIYGFPESVDPNDPDALWTVADPPWGTFKGTLSGDHGQGMPERVAGNWDLVDDVTGSRCAGPFMVELQP